MESHAFFLHSNNIHNIYISLMVIHNIHVKSHSFEHYNLDSSNTFFLLLPISCGGDTIESIENS